MDDEERDLLDWVDVARRRAERVDDAPEGPDEHARALWALGVYYAKHERAREAMDALRSARRAATAEARESVADPHGPVMQLAAIDLDLAEVALGCGELESAEQALRRAERQLGKHRLDVEEARVRIAGMRDRIAAERRPEPTACVEERFLHHRFGVGVLVARVASGLRLRFDDGKERVLLPERVTRVP